LGGRCDPINEAAIQWYSTFIDALRENGITPFVTLFPLALYERYQSF
jgi:beta-glucosidase